MAKSKPMLSNEELEQNLIGSILIDPACYQDVVQVTPDDFYLVRHRTIWRAIQSIIKDGPLDSVTLSDALDSEGALSEVGGSAYIAQIISSVPSALHARLYAEKLVALAQRRADEQRVTELMRCAYSGTDAEYSVLRAETARRILNDTRADRSDVATARDMADATLDEIMSWADTPLGPGEVRGLRTGLVDFDAASGGLHPGLWVLGGVTSAGKTALSLTVAVNVAATGRRVLYVSPEMTPADLMHRIICAYAMVDSRHIEAGTLTPEQLGKVTHTIGWVSELPLSITTARDMADIETKVRRTRPALTVLDGIEWITGAPERRTHEQRGDVARWALSLAADEQLQTVVWLPMQISKKRLAERSNKTPDDSDLYGSFEPAQAADVVMTLDVPDVWSRNHREHTGTANVIFWKFRKRRRIVPVTVALRRSPYGLFQNLAK